MSQINAHFLNTKGAALRSGLPGVNSKKRIGNRMAHLQQKTSYWLCVGEVERRSTKRSNHQTGNYPRNKHRGESLEDYRARVALRRQKHEYSHGKGGRQMKCYFSPTGTDLEGEFAA